MFSMLLVFNGAVTRGGKQASATKSATTYHKELTSILANHRAAQ